MTSLASLYDVGQGVPLDPARAHALREQAARLGEAVARGQLADDRRMRGQADFRRASVLTDLNMEAAAVPYARRAAAQGSANAQLLLARAYQFGAGVPRDYGQAFAFYRQAADGGLAEGARGLAYLYEFGLGVRVDRAKALVYYDQAAAGGLSKARQAAANLRSPDYDQPRGGGRSGGGRRLRFGRQQFRQQREPSLRRSERCNALWRLRRLQRQRLHAGRPANGTRKSAVVRTYTIRSHR